MNFKIKNVLVGLLLLAPLTENLTFHELLFGFDLRAWNILLYVGAMVIILINRLVIPIEMKYIASLLILHSIIVFLIIGNLALFTIVQITLFVITTIILYSIIKYVGIIKAIKVYQLAGIILSISIIIESIIYIIYGIQLYPTEIVGPFVKARGILIEPSEAAVLIAPAILSTLIWKQRFRMWLLVIGVTLSFSALSLTAMFLVFVIYALNTLKYNRYGISIIYFILIIGIFFLIFVNIPTTRSRIEGLLLSANIIASPTNDVIEYQSLGASVATLVLNAQVALRSMLDTYGIGIGFGNFRSAFAQYSSQVIDVGSVEGLFYNQTSGGSLLIRAIAEMGIFGLISLIYAIIYMARKYMLCSKLSNHSEYSESYVIALGIGLVTLISFLIRKDMWFSFNFSFILGLVFCVPHVSLKPRLNYSQYRAYSQHN